MRRGAKDSSSLEAQSEQKILTYGSWLLVPCSGPGIRLSICPCPTRYYDTIHTVEDSSPLRSRGRRKSSCYGDRREHHKDPGDGHGLVSDPGDEER